MNLAEVKRAKVSEERLVNQVIVNAEIEGVLARLGRVLITDPIQTPWNDLNGLVRVASSLALSTSFRIWLYHIRELSKVWRGYVNQISC